MKTTATVNGKNKVEFESIPGDALNGKIGNSDYNLKVVNQDTKEIEFFNGNQKFTARLLSSNLEKKELVFKMNGKTFDVKLEDEYDLLLKSMGLGAGAAKKINELKAPMPGVVVDVVVNAGDVVKKDDPIVVLEAMKMENMLKAPADVTIKSINIEKGDTVEKNKVLINFE